MSLSPPIQARKDAVVRAAKLEDVVKRRIGELRRKGREFDAKCPFHAENTPSFTVAPDKGFYHCFGCGAHGGLFDFVMAHDGLDFMGALAVLEAELGIVPGAAPAPAARRPDPAAAAARTPRDSSFIGSVDAARIVWRAGQRAGGTLVETYLRHRGIDPALSGILGAVRYHPRCPTGLWRRWEGPDDARGSCPAMLAPICRFEGGVGDRRLVQIGVHITFLAADGRGKKRFAPVTRRDGSTVVPPSRKIWGELSGGAVAIPPARWLHWDDSRWIDVADAGELVVAEGLESTLSLLGARPAAARGGMATLSLNNLQGFPVEVKVDANWAWPLWNMRPDPARPMFTLRDAGRVVIGVDADMKPLGERRVQEHPRGPVVKRGLSGRERAEVCGQLAAAAWRAAGAASVRVVRPAMGDDYNDVGSGVGRAA